MELYINDIQVDINERVPFPLTFQVSDIRDISKRKGSTSKTITLPGTQRNSKLMSGVFVVSASDSTSGNSSAFDDFDPTIKASARYYERGILQFEGICQLRDCIKKDGVWSFEIVLFQESIDIMKLLAKYKLRELGWDEYNHTLNKTNQVNSWSGSIIKNGVAYSNVTGNNWNGEGYYYGLIDYGFSRPTDDTFSVGDLAPQIFVKEIVDKMFDKIGVTYDSSFFDTQRFKKLLLAYEGGEFPSVDSATSTANSIETDWLTDGSGNVIDSTTQGSLIDDQWFFSDTNNFIGYISNNATDVDPSGLIQSHDPLKMVAQQSGLYKLTFAATIDVDLDFTVTGGSGSYDINWTRVGIIRTFINGQVYQQEVIYNETVTSTTLLNSFSVSGTFTFNLQLEPSDVVEVKFQFNNDRNLTDTAGTPTAVEARLRVAPTASVDVALQQVSIVESNTVNIGQFLPEKMTCAEFFKGLTALFYLTINPDEENPKALEIEPLDDFYAGTQDGFGNDITLDWTDIVDEEKEWRMTPTVNFADKEYKFSFQDDKDYWNTRYTDDVNKQYGSKAAINTSEFATKTNEQKLPFSQKPVVTIPNTDLIMPRSFQVKTDEGGLATIKPKKGKAFVVQVLNANAGTLRTGSWIHRDSVGDTARASYPYVGHIDDPDTPTFDLLYDVPDYVFYTLAGGQDYTTNNLYTYHERSIKELIDRHGKMLTCYIKLDANIINTLDFRKLIKIDGVVYKINKIDNYESGKEDSTKVELIKLIEGSNIATYTSVPSPDDKYDINDTTIDGTKIQEGTSVKSIGVDSDGKFVRSDTDVGEVIYKARLVQPNSDTAPTVTEYLNNVGTITSVFNAAGDYGLDGFSDLNTGKIEVEFSLQIGNRQDAVTSMADATEINIKTYDGGVLSNGVLTGGTTNYQVITVKRYA